MSGLLAPMRVMVRALVRQERPQRTDELAHTGINKKAGALEVALQRSSLRQHSLSGHG